MVVDSAYVDAYHAALKVNVETAIATEPGVLSLQVVYHNQDPTRFTIFEVFANQQAHASHQQTPHFKKYQDIIKNMVISTTRREVSPVILKSKLPSRVDSLSYK